MGFNRSVRALALTGLGILLLQFQATADFQGAADGVITTTIAETTHQIAMPIVLNMGNQSLTAVDDVFKTKMDTTLSVGTSQGVLANDSYAGESALTVQLVAGVAHGDLDLNEDGSFDYTPTTGFIGEDTFTYQLSDGTLTSNTATVTLSVTIGDNGAPTAAADAYEAMEDEPLSVGAADGVLANDSDPEQNALQASLVTGPANGQLRLNSDGSFVYTPAATFHGQDSFTYQASDGELVSTPATVTITVQPINDAPQWVSGKLLFAADTIGKSVRQAHEVVAGDFDRDGDLDVASADFKNGEVRWFQNDGGRFASFVLDDNLAGAYPVGVGDVNGDGHDDILAAGYDADTFVWYRNDGGGAFTRFVIDDASDGAHSIVTADVDGDGDTDLVTSSQDANLIAWYENDGAENFTLRLIDTDAAGAKRATPADVDGDGDLDVLAASNFSDEIAWHENDGAQNFTKHIIDSAADGAYFVSAADIDGDGDLDVFSANQNDGTFAMYRHDGAGGFTKSIVDANAPGARTIIAADIDGDGDMDLVGAIFKNGTFAWYRNDGTGAFTIQPFDTDAAGAYGVFAIDMDFDGDMDILSAAKVTSRVTLYTHRREHAVRVKQGGSVTLDRTRLHATDEDDSPAELTYTLVTDPTAGEVRLRGVALTVGSTFTQAEVDSGDVSYVHTAADREPDEFRFSVADGGEDGALPASGHVKVRVN
jgi:VCBS repeat-containing protein